MSMQRVSEFKKITPILFTFGLFAAMVKAMHAKLPFVLYKNKLFYSFRNRPSTALQSYRIYGKST